MARAAAELAALLTEPSYAGAARTLAGELRALPDVAGAVTLLERMAG
jgi:inosine-uridine nucleoside N-ribohydrolase